MWHLLRIFIVLCLIYPAYFVSAVSPAVSGEVYASDNSTVSLTVFASGVEAPQDFTVTFVDPQRINITWVKPDSANNTIILAKFYEYPTNREDGYIVYYGNGSSVNDTALDLDVNFGPVFYRAWSENITGVWSVAYAEGSTENPKVEELAEELSSFNAFIGSFGVNIVSGFLALLVIGILSTLAYFRPTPVIFIVIFALSWAFGLSAPDIISSAEATTSFDIIVTIACLVYGLMCAGWAFRLMFWRGENTGGGE